jgi:hypothetical protein
MNGPIVNTLLLELQIKKECFHLKPYQGMDQESPLMVVVTIALEVEILVLLPTKLNNNA